MLTLQYVPYTKIDNLSSDDRVNTLLDIIADNKIVLLQGKLKKTEETMLIAKTMERIAENSDNLFKGIELSTIDPETRKGSKMYSIKQSLVNMFFGDRNGLTIVGPANIVKEIKQDPEKIELFFNNVSEVLSDIKSETEASENLSVPKKATRKKGKRRR